MTSKANLPQRVKKAQAAAMFAAKVENQNGQEVYLVPGSNGKQYNVKVRRNGRLSFQCWTLTEKCKGNAHNTLCYHSMAVAIVLAGNAKTDVAWCANEQDAQRLEHLGGRHFELVSHDSGAHIDVVVS